MGPQKLGRTPVEPPMTLSVWKTLLLLCIGREQTQVFAGEVKDLEWDSENKRIVAVGDGQGTVSLTMHPP